MVTRNQAMELARQECDRRGLDFVEPATVNAGLRYFRVWTRATSRGGNVIISVHRRTGATEVVAVTPK